MIDRFDEVDNDIKLTMAEESSPLRLGLCALTLAQDMFDVDRMSADEIVEALDRLGIAVGQTSLVRAFARADDRIRRITEDGLTLYKAMTKGRQEVEHLLQILGPQVIYVQSGEHRTARERLRELLAGLDGVIRVCDPYYGVQSLDVLEMIPNTCDVRFLTGTTNEPARRISNAISYTRRQYPHIEIRIYPTPSDLHDRYLIEEDHFWLLGHGIKDVGNKESFIVRIKSDHAADLISDLKSTFDERWSNATAV